MNSTRIMAKIKAIIPTFLGLVFFFSFLAVPLGILVPGPEIEPVPSALGTLSLNTGLPGKSLIPTFYDIIFGK